MDDVGTIRAEFFIDGSLRYTDVGSQGHYHFGGAHNLWNTTTLADGPHTVRFVIVDTASHSCTREVMVTVANGTAADAGADSAVDAPAEAAADAPTETTADTPAEAPAEAAAEAPLVDAGADGEIDARIDDTREDTVAESGSRPDTPLADVGRSDTDAGTVKASDSGCGCDLSTDGRPSGAFGLLLIVAGLLAGRRRRGRARAVR